MPSKKLRRGRESMDPFLELPIDIIQTILKFLTRGGHFDKEAAKTMILSKKFLQAWSTRPNLYLVEGDFSKLLDQDGNGLDASDAEAAKQNHQVQEARERFANFIDRTLTRYQQHSIPVKKFILSTCVVDENYAKLIEQCIRKAKESRVEEFCLGIHMESFSASSSSSPTSLLQTIFGLKELVFFKLRGSGIDLVKDVVLDNGIIKCSSLRELGLWNVNIDEGVIRKLISSCPLIDDLIIRTCPGIETIHVTDMPRLRHLEVQTVGNQQVVVKADTLETLIYAKKKSPTSPYHIQIESAQNLNRLHLYDTDIKDEYLHCLIAKFPLLKALILINCNEIRKINVSSNSRISILKVWNCQRLEEVKIDAPNLNQFKCIRSPLKSLSMRRASVLVEHDPNSSTSSDFKCWRNHFKQANSF